MKLSRLLPALVAILIVTGCSDDDPTDRIILYDVVKLEQQTDKISVFTLQKPLADHPVTLTSPRPVIDTDIITVGERLLLAYIPATSEAYTDSQITVTGYSQITNGVLTFEKINDIKDLDTEPVYLLSVWRSGDCLNFHIRLPFDNKPRTFTLAADTDSADPSSPDLYLIHGRETIFPTFDRAYYASFDISALTDDPGISSFTLHLNNSNLPENTFRFDLR